jgi:hypothetical protein
VLRRALTFVVTCASLIALGVGVAPATASSTQLDHPVLIATTASYYPLTATCTSQEFCVAIIRGRSNYGAPEYSQVWNGSRLSAPRKIPGADFLAMDDSGGLNQVSCTSSSFCMAVGQGPAINASYRYTNGVWKEVPIPSPQPIVPAVPQSQIATQSLAWTSVSCLSSKFCFAVGRTIIGIMSNTTQTEKVATTYARWNGSTWSPVEVVQGADLEHVSCVTTTSCVAVGTTSSVWNGATWTVTGIPGETLNVQTETLYTGISCVAGATCMAVGDDLGAKSGTNESVVEWAHGAWRAVAVPKSPSSTGLSLYQINCRTATLCVALGFISEARDEPAVVSEWNGSNWRSATVSGQVFSGGGLDLTSATGDVMVDTNLTDTATLWLKG